MLVFAGQANLIIVVLPTLGFGWEEQDMVVGSLAQVEEAQALALGRLVRDVESPCCRRPSRVSHASAESI